MLELSIESIIKPMKTQGKTRVTGTIDDQSITIDLDSLIIHYEGQELLLETIQELMVVGVTSSCVLTVRDVAGSYLRLLIPLLVALVRRFIKPHSIEARQTVVITGN